MLLRRIDFDWLPMLSSSAIPVIFRLPLSCAGVTFTSISSNAPLFYRRQQVRSRCRLAVHRRFSAHFRRKLTGMNNPFYIFCRNFFSVLSHRHAGGDLDHIDGFTSVSRICGQHTESFVRNLFLNFVGCFFATILSSSFSNSRKNTSRQRERMVGGISFGILVVAPIKRKSAGSPF